MNTLFIVDLVRSELKLQTLNIMFFVLLLMSCVFGLFIVQNLPSERGVLAWGPYYITRLLITIGFIVPTIQSFFVVKATARDSQHKMEEMVFSASITKFKFIFTRWLGVFLPSLVLYFVFIFGIFIGLINMSTKIHIPIDHSLLFNSLVWASCVFILPAMLLSSILLFVAGLFTRSAFIVYLLAGLSFFIYQLFSFITGSPTMAQPFVLNETFKLVFDLVDPMAASEFYQQVQYWTVEQRNTQQVNLNTSLMFNRLLVLFASLVTAILGYQLFTQRLAISKPLKNNKTNIKSARIKNNSQTQLPEHIKLMALPAEKNHYFSTLFSLIKNEYLTTIATKTFLFIAAAWAILLGMEVLSTFSYQESLGVTSLATTSIAINRYVHDILPTFTSLFLVLFAAEITWRNKELGIADLIDVTPISNPQRFIAKWLALIFIPFTFITLAITISVLLQLLFAGTIEPIVYLSLYLYIGFPLVCIATLLLFINAISPNKLTAMTVSLTMVLLSQSNMGQYIGMEHGLFKFGNSPQLMHSELIGFSATSDAFWGYLALWGSLSILLALISFKCMGRGYSTITISSFIIGNKQRANLAFKSTFAFFTLVSLAAGFNVYYQTNVIGNYQSDEAYYLWKANYERAYAAYRDVKQPTIIDDKTYINLYPQERRYALNATYTLQNKTGQAISEVLVSTHSDVTYTNIKLTKAKLKKADPEFYQYIFSLETPLEPQEKVELSFSASRTLNGYNGIISDSFFTEEFIYYRNIRFVPTLGFNKYYTLRNDTLRTQYGLEPQAKEQTLEQDINQHSGDFSFQSKWASIETIISTSNTHTAIAPGELLNKTVVDNRNIFHYKTTQPIRHIQPIISSTLSVSKRVVDGTNLEVHHLAKHARFAQEHLDAMADTLLYGNQHFSPYPANQLHLFEIPNVLRMSGYAMPQMMLIDEELGFAVDRDNTEAFDHLYRRTAHETAHQWWGHGLDGAETQGTAFLIETLAVYTQAQILEQKYGPEYLHRLLRYASDRYFFGRGQSSENEKPLYRADENHLIYSKGAIAMNALQKKLGADVINQALKSLLTKFRYPNKPATTLDFIFELNHQTNNQYQKLINYWLKQVEITDWAIEQATITPNKDETFLLSVCLSNLIPQTEKQLEVELAVFNQHPEHLYYIPRDNKTLIYDVINLSNQVQCFDYTLLEKPKFIAVDPYYQGLDQNRSNNLKPLEY